MMKRFYSLDELSPSLFRKPIVTIGVFDGLHLGHAEVLRNLVSWAAETGVESVVVTFDHHPQSVLAGRPSESITSLEFRLGYFEKTGVSATIVLPFDELLAGMEAEDFVRGVFVERIGAEGVLLGFNTTFGRGGRGNFELIEQLAGKYPLKARQAAVVEVDGRRVSSTLVRELINKGDIAGARRLLGRPVCLDGTVTSGMGRGGTLGFPTANLELAHEVKPPAGVYGGRALIENSETDAFDALISIGRHPTFGSPLDEDLVEALLLDFDGDLRGSRLCVEVHSYIREQRDFGDDAALKAAISADVEAFRRHGKKTC